MITLKRKKDLIDLLIPYTYSINGSESKIKAGEKVQLNLEDDYGFFQLKYLYFTSPKILLKKDLKTEITVGTAINNAFILTMIPFLILIFILISFTDQNLGFWNDVAKIVGIAYFGVLCYFPTFGYKKYLTISIDY